MGINVINFWKLMSTDRFEGKLRTRKSLPPGSPYTPRWMAAWGPQLFCIWVARELGEPKVARKFQAKSMKFFGFGYQDAKVLKTKL